MQEDWLQPICAAARQGSCHTIREEPLPGSGRALALAPHPDDPDAIAVTLRMLQRGGWDLHWAIVTSGWSGVQDCFAGPHRDEKIRIRESEQRDSAALFGLPPAALTFLRLEEDEGGSMARTADNRSRLVAFLDHPTPDLVLLPYGEDTNATHRLLYQWLLEWGEAGNRPVAILGNEDPKTLAIRADFEVSFDDTAAAWKASILECHRSQSARNLALRGRTFADRILSVNRRGGRYVERFQLETR